MPRPSIALPFLFCFALATTGLASPTADTEPRHVILIIGDGMDEHQVTIARNYLVGARGRLLMDTLPIVLSGVCQRIDAVRVTRIQDASTRRVPFQRKIGAGLSLSEFEEKRKSGDLRHVGLTQSMHMIASRIGWKLDRVEDLITPVVADRRIDRGMTVIEAGAAAGVQQIGRGFVGSEEKITLTFRASIGETSPEDTVELVGLPHLVSTIPGGLHGDVATCAITLNAIDQLLRAGAGLRTMADLPPVSYFLSEP